MLLRLLFLSLIHYSSYSLKTVIVVPCYNEANRLNVSAFEWFQTQRSQVSFLFVDDGSSDDTFERVSKSSLKIMKLERNRGKAEAVRIGMLEAISNEAADITGFFDADLATPLEAVDDFLDVLQENDQIEMVFGARVALLGRHVKRHMSRHYLGRIFATLASMTLSLRIYDTQCGAKLFRVTSDLQHVLSKPFQTDWIFDVELLARFISIRRGDKTKTPMKDCIFEYPLKSWIDVKGSKLKFTDKVKALWGLLKVWWSYFIVGIGNDDVCV
jgi:dolichyl-phosphate beta-glucosyltransferase